MTRKDLQDEILREKAACFDLNVLIEARSRELRERMARIVELERSFLLKHAEEEKNDENSSTEPNHRG